MNGKELWTSLFISPGFSTTVSAVYKELKNNFESPSLKEVYDTLVQFLSNSKICFAEYIIKLISDFELIDFVEKSLDVKAELAIYVMTEVSLYIKKINDCFKDYLINIWIGILRWVASFDPVSLTFSYPQTM